MPLPAIVKHDSHGVATTIAPLGKLDHPVGRAYLLGEVLVAGNRRNERRRGDLL
jgi:hypothetical protein